MLYGILSILDEVSNNGDKDGFQRNAARQHNAVQEEICLCGSRHTLEMREQIRFAPVCC